MYELRDLYNSLTNTQKNLFLKNLDGFNVYAYVNDIHDDFENKSLEKKFYLFEEYCKEKISPKLFSQVYLDEVNLLNPNIELMHLRSYDEKSELIKQFSRSIFFTFIIKKDINKLKGNGKKDFLAFYEKDLTKHFKLTSNPIVNFYLIGFELNFLIEFTSYYNNENNLNEDVLEFFTEEQTILVFNSLKNILMNYNELTTTIINDYQNLKMKYEDKNKELSLLNINKLLKEQKIELNNKFRLEKENIQKENNDKLQKNKTIIDSLNKNNNKLEEDIKVYIKQLSNFKRNEGVLNQDIKKKNEELLSLEVKMKSLEDKMNELKEKNKELKIYKQENKANNDSIDLKFNEWLDFTVKNIIKDSNYFNETELFTAKAILKQMFDKDDSLSKKIDNDTTIDLKENNNIDDLNEEKVIEEKSKYEFIPVVLDEKFYPTHNGEPLKNIPPSLFFRERQIIKINNNNEFIEIYNSYLPDGFDLNLNKKILVRKNSNFYDVNDELVSVKNIPKNVYFKYKQFIVVDEYNNFLILMKKIKFNLDIIKEITDVRQQNLYVNLQIIGDQIYCIDLTNNKEILLSVNNVDYYKDMSKYSTFLVINNHIVKVFSTPLFYKLSSFYENKELMTVEVIDGEYYVRNLNKEFVKLKMDYVKFNLFKGDVVWVDKEDNNFLYQEESAAYLDKIKREKESVLNTTVSYKDKKKIVKELPDIEDSILIIGNPSNQNSYKLGFRKYGIDAKTIDGFANFNEIKKEFKNYNHIVFLANFASHGNQEKIKQENIEVYYPKKDGVNYIYDYIFKEEKN